MGFATLKIMTPPTLSNARKTYGLPLIVLKYIPSTSGPLSSLLFFKDGVPVEFDALKIAAKVGWLAIICSIKSFESYTSAPVVAFRILKDLPLITCNSS